MPQIGAASLFTDTQPAGLKNPGDQFFIGTACHAEFAALGHVLETLRWRGRQYNAAMTGFRMREIIFGQTGPTGEYVGPADELVWGKEDEGFWQGDFFIGETKCAGLQWSVLHAGSEPSQEPHAAEHSTGPVKRSKAAIE